MGNAEAIEATEPKESAPSSENLRTVLQRMLHEVATPLVEDATRETELLLTRSVEMATSSAAEGLGYLEQRVRDFEKRQENRMKMLESRVEALEKKFSGPNLEKSESRCNLDDRVCRLENFNDRTIETPREESWVNLTDSKTPNIRKTRNQCAGSKEKSSISFIGVGLMQMQANAHAVFKFNPDENPKEAMTVACQSGGLEDIKKLLDVGVDVESKDVFGCTPFQWASFRGEIAMMKFLLERGANPKMKNNFGCTAMHAAAIADQILVIELLLALGVDHSGRDIQGWTPLHYAVTAECVESVRVLLDAGANPNDRDNFGMVALDMTANTDIVRLLRR